MADIYNSKMIEQVIEWKNHGVKYKEKQAQTSQNL